MIWLLGSRRECSEVLWATCIGAGKLVKSSWRVQRAVESTGTTEEQTRVLGVRNKRSWGDESLCELLPFYPPCMYMGRFKT